MTNDCSKTVGPNHPLPSTSDSGIPDPINGQCVVQGDGTTCPPGSTAQPVECKPWQLTKANKDNCLAENLGNEALNIGGADVNLFKLLGVHEQTRLADSTGNGNAISGGAQQGFPAQNAFTTLKTEWRSLQTGTNNILLSAFIGYDFGEIMTPDNARRAYTMETSIRKHIMAFAIKQSSNSNQRVTRARLERSDNGSKWYGVQIVNLPDDDCLNTILSKQSAPSRYWRLRPLDFTGGANDRWVVQAFELYKDYQPTDVGNVQDYIFLENRNRDYQNDSIALKCSYTITEPSTDLTRYGIELPSGVTSLVFNFSGVVSALGRPIIIGDIIELPSESQYDTKMNLVKKYLEVTDVTWSAEGFTPGWHSTMIMVTAQPAIVSEQTQDIFGDLAENEVDGGDGLVDMNDGNHPLFQDFSIATDHVIAESKQEVPARGAQVSSTIREFSEEQKEFAANLGANLPNFEVGKKTVYTEDAMPPNFAPFTEGDEYPEKPKDKDYHRLTYSSIDDNLPTRLYRYSAAKKRWIYMETDRRSSINSTNATIEEFLTSDTKKPLRSLTRDDDC